MFLVGITGGIGTGKTTVANYFREFGIPIIDADQIARDVVEPGQPAYDEIKRTFGREYFESEPPYVLDRKKLGSLVFGNVQARRKLNSITHPRIRWEMFKEYVWFLYQGHNFVILDIPLLFESKWDRILQKIIVVACDQNIQLERVMNRDQSSAEEAQKRIDAQTPLSKKIKLATYVINNNRSISETKEQAQRIYGELRKSRAHWWIRLVLIGGLILIGSITFVAVKRAFEGFAEMCM